MIAFLRGYVTGKTDTSAYIDVNGVGFEVFMSYASLSKLPEPEIPVTVLTYLQVREDAMALFGFMSENEKALFEKLIGVSGIGPKVALSALSYFSPNDLAAAIAAQDVSKVSKIPGVGKKTAQRIILELKGSFELDSTETLPFGDDATQSSNVQGSVADALLSMGFTSAEASLALKDAPEGANEQVLLQYALKRLGSL